MTIYNLCELWPHLCMMEQSPDKRAKWSIIKENIISKIKTRNEHQQNNLSLAKVYSSTISWSFVQQQFFLHFCTNLEFTNIVNCLPVRFLLMAKNHIIQHCFRYSKTCNHLKKHV